MRERVLTHALPGSVIAGVCAIPPTVPLATPVVFMLENSSVRVKEAPLNIRKPRSAIFRLRIASPTFARGS